MKRRNVLGVTLLAVGTLFTTSIRAQDKPFTSQQVLDMVHAGLSNDSGAKLIVQRGIDFTPQFRIPQTPQVRGRRRKAVPGKL